MKNLEDATIKALQESILSDTYEQLDTNPKEKPIDTSMIEGLVDDVLIITDPQVSSEEYDEIIERAQEIVEDTPEGDIPFNEEYIGQYAQTCPVCGGTFVTEEILEPGATCPICLDIPEAFVMVGQLGTDEDGMENFEAQEALKEPKESKEEEDNLDSEELNLDFEDEEEKEELEASEEIKTSDNKLEESTNNYNFEDIVMSSYNHLKNDLGKNPSEDDIFDDIIHNYEQNFISDKSPEDSSNAIKSIKYVLDQNNVEAIADSQQETIKEESKNNCNFEVGFYTYNDTNVASMFLRCNETNKGCWAYINLDDNDNIVNIEYPQVDTPMFNEDPEFMSFINTLQTDCKDKVMEFAKDVVSKTASYRKNYTPKEEKPAFDISKYNTVDEIDKRLSEIQKQFAYIKRRDKVSLALDGEQEKANLEAEKVALKNKLKDLLNKETIKEESVSLQEKLAQSGDTIFGLKIACCNDAFGYEEDEEEQNPEVMNAEVARILRVIADKVEQDSINNDENILDINGNIVGKCGFGYEGVLDTFEESKEHNLSKDLFGDEAEKRNSQRQKEFDRDLQYVKDILAGKEVIDDKYNEKLDLATAKKWLRDDYIYINNLFTANPEEINQMLAKDLPEIFGEKVEESIEDNDTYNYQLLDRLRSDCDYYLGAGNKNEDALWAKNVNDQIAKMKELYNSLSEKPEWLTMEDIEGYEKKMTESQIDDARAESREKGLCENVSENEIIQLHNSIEEANDADEIQELIYTISDGTLENLVQQAYDTSIQDEDELEVLKDFVIATLEDNAEYEENKGTEEIIEESKEDDDEMQKLFNELVPTSGPADTVAGELVRAFNKIEYRYYNDGDLYFNKYGLEICGDAACYLINRGFTDLLDKVDEIPVDYKGDLINNTRYEDFLNDIKKQLLDYINENPKLKETPNTEDCLADWDAENVFEDFAFGEVDYDYEMINKYNLQDDLQMLLDDMYRTARISNEGTITNVKLDDIEDLENEITAMIEQAEQDAEENDFEVDENED